jgi:hypothetical protein
MQHQPVKSSRIASVAYDEASGILEIRFHGDITLRYEKVPAHLSPFLQVVSKGVFMMASSKEIYRTPGD